jgi:DNA-binding MarR family transcriptional regulator
MNISIDNLNKAFESKTRLGIMSVLMVNESVDFSTLKSLLNLTDGNLASHTRALEEMGYIQCEKRFIGRKPNTTFQITQSGSQAFKAHLQALEALIQGTATNDPNMSKK